MHVKVIRVIPRLDIKNHNLIKGINLEGLRVLGNPYEYAKRYFYDGCDELIFNDAIASLYGINSLGKIIKSLAKNIHIPINAGGGLKSIKDIELLFSTGADKIFINSSILKNNLILKKSVNYFGSPNITALIEVINYENKFYTSYLSGRELAPVNPFDWAKSCEDMGCGEIIVTSVNNEGLMHGTDIKLFEKIAKKITIPLLAHGGFGNYEHVYNLIKKVDVSAVIISSLFHYNYIKFVKHKKQKLSEIGNYNYIENIKTEKRKNIIYELKKYLKKRKIDVRF